MDYNNSSRAPLRTNPDYNGYNEDDEDDDRYSFYQGYSNINNSIPPNDDHHNSYLHPDIRPIENSYVPEYNRPYSFDGGEVDDNHYRNYQEYQNTNRLERGPISFHQDQPPEYDQESFELNELRRPAIPVPGTFDVFQERPEYGGADEERFIENNFQAFPEGEDYKINTYADEEIDGELQELNTIDSYKEGDDPEEEDSTGKIKRSPTTTRLIKLIHGNLILDCPVASSLLEKYRNVNLTAREFQFMRYQAVTCDPKFFSQNNFTLRQECYQQPRTTEIMIVVTMYNENDILLARTLKGIFRNIKYMEKMKHHGIWGEDSWKKIVVTIVSDGRQKINERARSLIALLGCYQDGFAKNMVNNKEVVSHVYEYTTKIDISEVTEDRVKLTSEDVVPVQLIFCLKEKNQKKINSHRWCFDAFCPILKPKVIVLLDAGTQPSSNSIYKLWKEFHDDPRVAGACGEIRANLGKRKKLLINPLVAAQNFEYKTSNILDKPMESVFGFVSVLPGAFSAYRYVALLNDQNGIGPLEKYFKGEDLHSTDAGIFSANMYLAEDRILCFELVAKKECAWLLRYVNSAHASTDVPERLDEFISQRRRWLNGSFFAAIYSVFHFYKLWGSGHSLGRKVALHLEFVYQFLSLLVSWFSMASYFLVFRILTSALGEPGMNVKPGKVLGVVFLWLYLMSIVTTFVLAFGNRPKGTQKFYIVIVCFFAIMMVYMIFAAVLMAVKAVTDILQEHANDFQFYMIFTERRFRDLIVATASTYALYLIGALLFLDPWHMFTSFAQYILLSPSYVNVLNIYAFCNIHDISWGTKGEEMKLDLGVLNVSSGESEVNLPIYKVDIEDAYSEQMKVLSQPYEEPQFKPSEEEKEKDFFAFIRSMTVLIWMFTNFVIIALVLETGGVSELGIISEKSNKSEIFLTVILWIVAFMALFRFLGCTTYLVTKYIRKFKVKVRQ
ncbi:BA75_01139T0 [Komagataella pastoris]|uniref:Chitin synthase n=1 Tax=Komagataella pastoris TaxID=4922 RepID=A0A1B2JAB9_PICPA|nr:BA75_01139T0 [Komagataella pastoris]